MTRGRGVAVVLTLAVAGAGVACKDVPLAPHWYANWNVPLPSQDISLLGPFPWVVPAGTSTNIAFPPLRQLLTGAAGSLLGQQLSRVSLVLRIGKNVPVAGTDTVFVALDSAGLWDSAATRIVVPVSMTATDQLLTDTIPIATTGVTMLQNVALAKGAVWVQLRGYVLFPGPGMLSMTASDSVHVRLSLLATIAISR